MQMQRSAMNGCCVGAYFYDLGGAHSKYRARSIEEFAFRMIDLGYNQINTAATNSSQGPERKFLEQLGFKEVLVEKGMHVHVVGSSDLEMALKPFREKRAEAVRIEQEKKREAAKKAAEEAAARQAKQRELVLKAKNMKRREGNDPVTKAQLQAFFLENADRPGAYPTVPFAVELVKAYYGVTVPGWDPYWDIDAYVTRINMNLPKEEKKDVEPVKKATKEEKGAVKKRVLKGLRPSSPPTPGSGWR